MIRPVNFDTIVAHFRYNLLVLRSDELNIDTLDLLEARSRLGEKTALDGTLRVLFEC